MDLEKKFDILLVEIKKICDKIDDKFEKIEKRIDNPSEEMKATNRTIFNSNF